MYGSTPTSLSFSSIFRHGALLKAFWTSSRITIGILVDQSEQKVCTLLPASIVDLPGQKPNCLGWIEPQS